MGELHIYLGVALAGLVSFLSPCVLPLVPPYLGFLGGTTLELLVEEGQEIADHVYRRIVLSAVCFVLGFTTVFVGLGATASALGQFLWAYREVIAIPAGLIIIAFGLHFLGILKVGLFYRQARWRSEAVEVGYLGAYVIGLAFAFGWTPCIGPILAAVLATAASEASLPRGVALLATYSLGLGIPFLLAAIAIRPFLGFFRRFRRHLPIVEKVMGAALIVTGLLFVTGSINMLGQWMLENMPWLAQLEESLVPAGLKEQILGVGR